MPVTSQDGVRERATLVAILGVAAVFRLYEIDVQPAWIDEANAILTAAAAPSTILHKLRLDSSPPLFYLLVHGWMQLVGDGLAALRLLSCATGVALTGVTWWVGRDLVSRPVGTWAALFVATSPVQAYYSQQVRMYALLPLLALLSVAFLVRFLRDGRRSDQALWLLSTVAALYTHNFAMYVLGVEGVLIALSGRLLRDFRVWAVSGIVLAVAYAPWVPTLLLQLENHDHYAWFLAEWRREGPWGMLVQSARSFSPGAEAIKLNGLGLHDLWKGWPTLGALLLAILGGAGLVRSRAERGAVAALWPLVFLLVPIAGAMLASLVMTPHYVPGRVDQMIFPAFALLVGQGIAALGPAPLRLGVAAAVVLVASSSKLLLYPDGHPPRYYVEGDLRYKVEIEGGDAVLAQRIAEAWRPGDVVLTTSLTRASLQYYLGRSVPEARILSFPRETGLHLGSQNDARLLSNLPELAKETRAVLDEVRAMLPERGRVFVVRVRSSVNAMLSQTNMERQDFRQVDHLGHFDQLGTRAVVEVGVFESSR